MKKLPNDLYNEKIKEEFLNIYDNEETKNNYKRIFQISSYTEKATNKDIYDFNMKELESVLYDLDPLTKASSESNGRILTSYISWCISKGYKKGINILKTVDSDWFDKFVDKNKKIYWSYKEIKQIISRCENAQDAAPIRLLFSSVNGKGAAEIRNLKKQDIDSYNNTLRLTDYDGSQRIIKVEEDVIDLCIDALNEKEYVKRNGVMEYRQNVSNVNELFVNDYVFRNSQTRTTNENGPVQSSVIYRRINLIGETLSIPYFTSKNIFRSGMIYLGRKLLEKNGELGNDQYKEIAKEFKINNWYSLKDFVNYDNIYKLYGEISK
ncbi:hypothetical protein B7C51_24920 (plasmid) [Paenibacillus larvae subsp. pulvifaciens]|uniref:Uncharacterized protein n=1 Tax=Paenibacillus larvae subsp. pulvifaciens TaxID=1477 RepID=A0A1V0UZZ0_9BACL|nr:hypothetical protein [Paenibacillus larvae]ARF70719.1 hypothetical protein B7C51_24920 [Paenibacillus larvae subsp. pulvifaciens]